ncbi:MAG: hypothetical protein EXS05_16700 [Planctomycetaceae bacterium]|nr:hypothetical protein [Planctomycetaceae bacterium]
MSICDTRHDIQMTPLLADAIERWAALHRLVDDVDLTSHGRLAVLTTERRAALRVLDAALQWARARVTAGGEGDR